MSTELDDRLAALAAAWDDIATPVSSTEIRARAVSDTWVAAAAAITPTRAAQARARRRAWPMVVVAVGVAAGVVALAAVVRHDSPQRSIAPAVTDPGATVVSTSAGPSASESLPEEPSPGPATAAQLAEVAAEVHARLSQLNGFRATATVRSFQQMASVDGTAPVVTTDDTRVNAVTLMADGSIWSEGDSFLWTSYDAATGVSRGAFEVPGGATRYQEVVGWPDNSTPLLLVVGFYPVMHFDGLREPALREVTSPLGRPAWVITAPSPGGFSGSPQDELTEAFTIDQQTGLVVAYERRLTNGGTENRLEAHLTDLVVDVELPAAFPGSFPDGAVVDRSGDPNGFVPLSVQQAAAAFGAGFVVPSVALAASPRVALVVTEMPSQAGSPAGAMYQATIEWHTGFVTSSFGLTKSVITDGALPPPGMISVDGAWCTSTDGVHCQYYDAPSIITAGAWAGAPSQVDGSMVSITNGPFQATAMGPTAEASLAIANSLTTVES